MKRTLISISLGALFLSSCGGLTNGNSYAPSQSATNLALNKLQLAVGTARLPDGTTGLNVVATYRQPNGLSGTLVNTPSIAGPSGFVVPAGAPGAGTDAGTSSITGAPQVFPTPSSGGTFGTIGGVFASGLAPLNNNTNSKNAYYPGNTNGPNPSWTLPFYNASGRTYLIGPPAVPFFNDGSYPTNFAGYMSGFTPFELTPIAGNYTMTVTVSTATSGAPTFTASAALSNLTPLPALSAPTFTKDGAGGGTATVAVPADPRIVETLIYVVDNGSGTNIGAHPLAYTSAPIAGSGTLTFTVPPNLGPCATVGTGCQNTHPGVSITTGDQFLVYAVTFDYKQFEALPPGNVALTPTIAGASGQSDVSMSPVLTSTY